MNFKTLPKWVLPWALGVALIACVAIVQRHRVESRNKAVCLVAEYEVVEALAAAQGIPIDKAIESLKLQGLMGVVLAEESLGELIGQGRVAFTLPANQPPKEEPPIGLTFTDAREMARVRRALQIRFQNLIGRSEGRGATMALPQVSQMVLKQTSVGLNPQQARTATKHGLMIVARCSNPNGLSGKGVRETLAWAKSYGASVYLPQGEQVLGRREAMEDLYKGLIDYNMLYASPEFAKLGGDANVLDKEPTLVIRLHSAQAAELDKLPEQDAVDRYVKAARERSMRMLLLRPITSAAALPLTSFGEFVRKINLQIQKEGGAMGLPRVSPDNAMPRIYMFGLALAGAPLVWVALALFFTSPKARTILIALCAILVLASVAKTGQQVMALCVSMAAPLIGFAWLVEKKPKSPWVGFGVVSLVSVVGGLFVAGMLTGLNYAIRADEFRAVKLSVFFPIPLVGFLCARNLVDWKSALKSPITWGAAGVGILILGVLMLMLARTGNDSGVGGSSTELLLRNILDRVLYVRPRTKEFLIGHPLLFVGCGLLAWIGSQNEDDKAKWGGWVSLVVMLAAMGQTDVVNTLTHMHIPVFLSLVRIAEGWVLGAILGAILWFAVQKIILNPKRAVAEVP